MANVAGPSHAAGEAGELEGGGRPDALNCAATGQGVELLPAAAGGPAPEPLPAGATGIVPELRALAAQPVERTRVLHREALARKVWELALRGEMAAIRLILEYCEGKPVNASTYEISLYAVTEYTADELAQAHVRTERWEQAVLTEG